MIRRYTPPDKQGILQLIGSVFGDEISSRTKDLWEWRFEQNPYTLPEGQKILVLEEDSQIVGVLASFPVPMKVYNRSLIAFWFNTFLTHPRYRGMGAGLAAQLISTTGLGLGIPNRGSYDIWKAIGCFDCCKTITWSAIINPKAILRKKKSSKIATNVLGNAWALFNQFAFDQRNLDPPPNAFSCEEVHRFDQTIDALWGKVASDYPIATIRESRYLNWRFIDCPVRKYSAYIARKAGAICGYIIFRNEQVRGLKRGYIVDFLTTKNDKTALSWLVSNAVRSLRKEGVDIISCLVPRCCLSIRATLRRHGFVFKEYEYSVVGNALADYISSREVATQDDWFLTMGDSETDFVI